MTSKNQLYIQCKYPDAKILVVDDAEDFIKYIALILDKAGCRNVTTLTDPEQAAQTILSENPDVVLLDYEMPKLTGLDVLRCLAKSGTEKYLPVLVLTVNDDPDIRLQCLDSGAQDFIQKPFDTLDLLLKLNNIAHLSMLYKHLESENYRLDHTVRYQESTINTERQSRFIAEEKLQHRLYHDILTDLPNKILLNKYLLRDIEYAHRNHNFLGILVIVIDNIRDINYTLGHVNGDLVIQRLAKRLTSTTRGFDSVFNRKDRAADFLSRISDSGFAILVPNLRKPEECKTIAERLLKSIEEPIKINDLHISPKCHIGIVYYPDHGDDVDTLLKHADIAAYQAKTQRQAIKVYSRENDEFTERKLALAQTLKKAILEDNLDLYLQPKLSLKTHTVVGFECLLRWRDPTHGFVSPDLIIEIAENTGLIPCLTRWVIKRAISLGKCLIQAGYPYTLAVNITASDLLNIDTMQHVLDTLEEYSVKPESITLELTEGTVIHDPIEAMEMIRQFSDIGVKLSIDDFGTGYSSLAYLQKLKVDELKIDRSFIMDLDTNIDNQKIVQSIINIAHHLNLSVVAEGVENSAVYNLLTEYECDVAQGYYMAKPMPFEDVQHYLTNYQIRAINSK